MYFKYIGYDKEKNTIKGVIEANSSREAIQELERNGVEVVLKLKQSRGAAYKERLVSFKNKISKPLNKITESKLLQKGAVKIELKDADVLRLLKRLEAQDDEEAPGPINNIFIQPAEEKEEVEFRKKEKRRAREVSIDWENIKRPQGDVKKMRVPFKETLYFTRQLSVLLSSGVTLSTALATLSETTRNSKMKRIIKQIYEDIQSGNSLSYALSSFPNQFNNLYVSLVSVGESSGTLATCLKDLADFQDLQNKIRKRVRSAMVYPAIIFVVVILLLILGSHFLIPMFKDLFDDIGAELPPITKIVFWLADYVKYFALGLLIFVVFFFIISPKIKSLDKTIRQVTDRLFLKLPVFKRITLTLSMFYFSNPLALMQKNGIRLIDSLRMAFNVVPNYVIKGEIQDATYLLMEGVSIAEALSEQPHFDSIFCSMVKTGEESGRIDRAFEHLSNYYSEQLRADIETLLQIIQPLTILLIAMVVVPVAFAIMLPILDLTSGGFM